MMAQSSEQTRGENDEDEGHVEEENRHEGKGGDGDEGRALERLLPDAENRLGDNGDHGGRSPWKIAASHGRWPPAMNNQLKAKRITMDGMTKSAPAAIPPFAPWRRQPR